jgi:hypothetical protein
MRRDIEVIYQLPLATVILEINSGIISFILHGGEVRYPGLPTIARAKQIVR